MRNGTLGVTLAMLIGLVLIFVGVGTIETERSLPWSGFWPGVVLSCLGLAIVAWVAYRMRKWRRQ